MTTGDYMTRSLIAEAQRCVNLFLEPNPEDAPYPNTFYNTAGLTQLIAAEGKPSRCCYRASNGQLFEVVGPNVYYTDASLTRNLLGTIADHSTPAYMADNGLVVVLVDGTSAGYYINLTSHVFTTITDIAFYGSVRVDYLDTFFVFQRPDTNQMYISPSEWDGGEPFDLLDIAAKVGTPDNISGLVVMHREIWLLGTNMGTEVWYNSGAADFTFERMPGVFVDHGCISPYSIAAQDVFVYWLSRDRQGRALVLAGSNYEAKRVSTYAMEQQIAKYGDITDAVGFTYQQDGHTFYQLNFPSANVTWCYDVGTDHWHEKTWTDDNGVENRHRANNAAQAYEMNVCGDWQNGTLYAFDSENCTDFDGPIVRRRGFPHLVSDGDRVFFRQFSADFQTGSAPGTSSDEEPQLSLRWSDDGGYSWNVPVLSGAGAAGQYVRQVQWQRLGMARDRVFELFWSFPYQTAVSGAWIDIAPAKT